MQVIQEFSIKRKSEGRVLYVRVIRFPNANGIIDSVHSRSLDNEDNEMMEDEFDYKPKNITNIITEQLKKDILEVSAKLWDEYWTVDNIKCAKDWTK